MPKRFYTILTSVLAALVTTASMANTATAFRDCLPKVCCCSSNVVAHGATSVPHDVAGSNCHGKAPCCQVQPSAPFPDMALFARPEVPSSESMKLAILPDFSMTTPQLACFNAPVGNLTDFKIPPPKLYLQHQSFLC